MEFATNEKPLPLILLIAVQIETQSVNLKDERIIQIPRHVLLAVIIFADFEKTLQPVFEIVDMLIPAEQLHAVKVRRICL
jgi:hypothetical protein